MIAIAPMPALLGAVLAAMVAVMTAAWGVQRLRRDTGWVDVFWTFGTGASCASAALWPLPADEAVLARRLLVAMLVGVWSLRLGSYITIRVSRGGAEDARYRRLRAQWGSAYSGRLFWFLQIQAVVTTVLAFATALAARAPGPLDFRAGLAVLVWTVAMGGEALADDQMRRFKADPHNRGGICDRGLWAWSRHPNYFFEWLGWFAYPILAIRADAPLSLAALGAPLVMYLVLRFGSGGPPLEESMLESRGDAFRAYQARTSAFLPLPPRSV